MPQVLDFRFEPVAGGGARLGESPFWDHGDAIWWIDIAGRRLFRTSLSSRSTTSWPTPQIPGFVVLMGPERPAVGMENGIYGFSTATGRFETLIPFAGDGLRFNDATVDGTGRLWASTMALDNGAGRGALHRVTPGLELEQAIEGLSTPNGLAADMEGGRLFLSDSHRSVQTIWRMDCDFGSGALAPRESFASMQDMAGRPDGAAFDEASGHYWIAAVDGGALLAFDSGGNVTRSVSLPFPSPTKLAFAGRTIAVTAKDDGGYSGDIAFGIAPDSQGSIEARIPFWRFGA